MIISNPTTDIKSQKKSDPKKADVRKMLTGDYETMKSLRGDAYDLVINGVEIGGAPSRCTIVSSRRRTFACLDSPPNKPKHNLDS